jgi:hypothetical protein
VGFSVCLLTVDGLVLFDLRQRLIHVRVLSVTNIYADTFLATMLGTKKYSSQMADGDDVTYVNPKNMFVIFHPPLVHERLNKKNCRYTFALS